MSNRSRLRDHGSNEKTRSLAPQPDGRGDDTNYVHISYDKINEHKGINRDAIRAGLSILAATGLVHVENAPSSGSLAGGALAMYNRYRLTHLDSYKHAGTSGRAGIEAIDGV